MAGTPCRSHRSCSSKAGPSFRRSCHPPTPATAPPRSLRQALHKPRAVPHRFYWKHAHCVTGILSPSPLGSLFCLVYRYVSSIQTAWVVLPSCGKNSFDTVRRAYAITAAVKCQIAHIASHDGFHMMMITDLGGCT